MLEVILVPFLLDKVTPQFNTSEGFALLNCSEAAEVIQNLNKRAPQDVRDDLIETIKLSTEPGCYEEIDSTAS